MGGKCVGNVQLMYQKYYVRQAGRRLFTVSITDFPTLDQAYMHAKRLLYDYCAAEGLLINEYRYVSCDADQWLEVKTKSGPFICDTNQLRLVEEYTWGVYGAAGRIWTSDRKLFFPRSVLNLPTDLTVSFLDENPRNNRKSNLLPKRGLSGPIVLHGNYWTVKPTLTSGSPVRFSVKKYGAVEAKRLALEAALQLVPTDSPVSPDLPINLG